MKLTVLVAVFVLFFCVNIFGAYFEPVDGLFPDSISPEYISVISGQMQNIADEFNKDDVIVLAGNQEKFACANNNAASSTLLNGSLYTRTEIDTVALGVGASAGIVNPDGFMTIADDLNEGKDVSSGLALNTLTVYASVDGSNYGSVFLKDLLFDVKLGYFSGEGIVQSIDFDSFMAGGGIRYKVYKPEYSSQALFLRPVTIGIGVYHVSSSMSLEVDDLKQNTKDDATQISTSVTSDLLFKVDNSTTTVPLELVSSARFLGFLNLMLGTGCDLVFGSTEVDLEADSSVSVSHSSLPVPVIQSPDLKLHDSETVENTRKLRYKILGGVGFELGIITLDLPVTYYPVDNGFAISLVAAGTF